MGKGFYTLLIAQFLSAVADNALLFAAIALLHNLHSPPGMSLYYENFS